LDERGELGQATSYPVLYYSMLGTLAASILSYMILAIVKCGGLFFLEKVSLCRSCRCKGIWYLISLLGPDIAYLRPRASCLKYKVYTSAAIKFTRSFANILFTATSEQVLHCRHKPTTGHGTAQCRTSLHMAPWHNSPRQWIRAIAGAECAVSGPLQPVRTAPHPSPESPEGSS
jgi:hypothetical protein